MQAEEQKFIIRYMRIKIQKINEKYKTIYVDPSEAININEDEISIASSSQIHFNLEKINTGYKLLLEGCAPENISGGSFEVTFYSSNNIKKQEDEKEKTEEEK